MKDRWEELVRERTQKIAERLERRYEDENTEHRFSVNRVEPVGYRTRPIIIDYNLFVDIQRTDRDSGEVRVFRDVSLGSYINSGPRELISFGTEYFDETNPELIEIVGDTFRDKRRYKDGTTKR